MSAIKKLTESKIYNIVVNGLVMVSILYIIVEKLFYFEAVPYLVLVNIDYGILGLFALDFLLRFAAKRFQYFIKEYGWIDLLAIIPIVSPAIKIFRFLRVLRTARMLRFLRTFRLLRFLKFVKSDRTVFANASPDLFLPVSSFVMVIMIAFSTLLIYNNSELNHQLDLEKENAVLAELSDYSGMEARTRYLEEQEIVLDVLKMSETEKLEEYSRSVFRSGDIQIRRQDNLYVVFSRKRSMERSSRFEGILYVITFLVTALILMILSLTLEKKLFSRIRLLNDKALDLLKSDERERLEESSGDLETLEQVLDILNKR